MSRLMWLAGGALVAVSAEQIAGLPGLLIVVGVLLMALAVVKERAL